jgi:sporulation protein YlmC with PRC-barrel domain
VLRRALSQNVPSIWNTGRIDVFPSQSFHTGRKHMLAKYMTAGVAASALLATVAFAQNPSPTDANKSPPAAASTTTNSSHQGEWRASKVVGLSVYNNNNESIGSINDLLTDKSGSIKAVVIGVGGFLGVGEHLVAVPFDQVKFVNEPVAYTGASSGSSKSTSTTGASGSSNTAPSSTTSSSSTSATKSNPWYPDHAVFNASKDQLKGMPEFKYSS